MNPFKELFKLLFQVGLLGGILFGLMYMVNQSDQRQAAKLAANQQSQSVSQQSQGGGAISIQPSPGTSVTQDGNRIVIRANPTPAPIPAPVTPPAAPAAPVQPAPPPVQQPTQPQSMGTPIFDQPSPIQERQIAILPSHSPISIPSNPQTGQPYRQNGMIWVASGGLAGWIMESAIATPAPQAAAQPYQPQAL